MRFKENLRFLMECRGIQTKELSKITGISENTIKSYIKEDSAEPKVSKAIILAEALNVSLEYLVTGKEIEISSLDNKKEINTLLKKIITLSTKEQRLVTALVNEIINQK